MALRPAQNLLTIFAAFAASVAMLLYAFAAPGTHAPKLHTAQVEIVVAAAHPHSHGDHSHDDMEMDQDDGASQDHHHADHSHEKAELVRAGQNGPRASVGLDYSILATDLASGPPYGIDRPPRPVTLI
ncbi:hypothetical protein J2Z19_001631 [Ensifer adhaerens]|uniref:Uncharacterized protein n=1 Tax=Ensifer adhaerens TaxID=106592 RepID=A0ACC5SU44_ENSAD|nr:hypothetical protein [Ensifer adhaerens]MBP1871919.1 hypothetical protein [Ensifer adhaerens]